MKKSASSSKSKATSTVSSKKANNKKAVKPAAPRVLTNSTVAVRSSKTSKNATAPAATRSKKAPNTSAENLEKVFINTLKDIYWAEKQLTKALKKLAKAANNEELADAFESHQQETEGHVEKLDQVFELLGMRATGKKCEAMEGLLKEGAEQIEEYEKGPARDAALIVAAQKVEHYEISAYGSLSAFALVLGHTDCQEIFDEIHEQESGADSKLTDVAKTVNQEAYHGDEEEDEDDEDTDDEELDEDEDEEEA